MPSRLWVFGAAGVLAALLAACGGSEFSAAGSGGSAGLGGSAGSAGSDGSGAGTESGGTGGSGGAGGSGGTGGRAAACLSYIDAYCQWAERCGQYLYGGSLAACRSIAEEQCAWYELPGTAISAADYAGCVASYGSTDCSDVPACVLPPGTVENGFACATTLQCASGYCTGGSGACGVCAPNPRHPIGGDCQNPLVDCEADLGCVEGTCTPKRKEGEPCDEVRHCETLRELGQLRCIDGTCTVVGRPGEPCPMTEGGNPYCGFGTACTTENVCVLLEGGEEGDVCGTFADRVVSCPDGSCQADPDDPTMARCMSWAGPGESCKKVPGFERCALGLVCMGSVCVWPDFPELPEDCG